MNKLIYIALFSMALSLIVFFVFLLSSSKKTTLKSPFECGFMAMSESRSSISTQFFQISLIFLIFDIELILLFPYIFISFKGMSMINIFLITLFFSILTIGLFYEWFMNLILWMK